jgi:DNA-binding NtrC family response regulator
MLVTMTKQILVAADDRALLPTLPNLLRTLGYEPTVSGGAAEAIARLAGGRFEFCIVDIGLPAREGAAVIMKARASRPPVTAIALTAEGSVAGAVEALRAGAADVIAKPFHASTIEDALRRLTAASPERASPGRRTPGVAIIGDHPAMRLVLDRVEQIADTDASVLVRGETGTGKEVVARLIHGASARRARPFVAVNLAAIPASLAEAELFGHLPGAFAGADRARAGRMAAAHGGTLFFDEIGDLPRPVQAKLLRALQEGAITPVGAGAPVPVDVRVIAATQRDLRALVADGRFREDLYYRLDVLPIEIPPLRARRDDIPALAEHFRDEINAREGRRVPGFALDVMRRLTHYDWPGNVRELENLVARVVVVAATRMVVMDDLPCHLRTQVVDLETAGLDLPAGGVDLAILLAEIEERMIAEALRRASGNRDRAAALLRLSRGTLIEKLRRKMVA